MRWISGYHIERAKGDIVGHGKKKLPQNGVRKEEFGGKGNLRMLNEAKIHGEYLFGEKTRSSYIMEVQL